MFSQENLHCFLCQGRKRILNNCLCAVLSCLMWICFVTHPKDQPKYTIRILIFVVLCTEKLRNQDNASSNLTCLPHLSESLWHKIRNTIKGQRQKFYPEVIRDLRNLTSAPFKSLERKTKPISSVSPVLRERNNST